MADLDLTGSTRGIGAASHSEALSHYYRRPGKAADGPYLDLLNGVRAQRIAPHCLFDAGGAGLNSDRAPQVLGIGEDELLVLDRPHGDAGGLMRSGRIVGAYQ